MQQTRPWTVGLLMRSLELDEEQIAVRVAINSRRSDCVVNSSGFTRRSGAMRENSARHEQVAFLSRKMECSSGFS